MYFHSFSRLSDLTKTQLNMLNGSGLAHMRLIYKRRELKNENLYIQILNISTEERIRKLYRNRGT